MEPRSPQSWLSGLLADECSGRTPLAAASSMLVPHSLEEILRSVMGDGARPESGAMDTARAIATSMVLPLDFFLRHPAPDYTLVAWTHELLSRCQYYLLPPKPLAAAMAGALAGAGEDERMLVELGWQAIERHAAWVFARADSGTDFRGTWLETAAEALAAAKARGPIADHLHALSLLTLVRALGARDLADFYSGAVEPLQDTVSAIALERSHPHSLARLFIAAAQRTA